MKYFAGIGSRATTKEEHEKIKTVCAILKNHEQEWCLTSGAASGADEMFESDWSGDKRIFLPWAGFNERMPDGKQVFVLNRNDKNALRSVDKFHPSAQSLSHGARMLMARNFRQVVPSPTRKVNLVVFVADEDEKGNVSGGTAQAVRIARFLKIPCLNLRRYDDYDTRLQKFLKKISKKP